MKRFLIAIVFSLAACTSSPASEPDLSDTAEVEVPASTSVAEVIEPTAEAAEGSQSVEEESQLNTYPPTSLTEEGPWLIYYDDMGGRLIAMNRDGSGWTQLNAPQPTTEWDKLYEMERQVFEESPNGLIAYISGDSSDDLPNPDPFFEMILLELPSGEIFDRIPLIEPAWNEKALPTGIADRAAYLEQVKTSITMAGSIDWSEDGRYLAYIGATHGPSADVYVYDTQSKASRVMTSGSGQAAALDFSPDGTRLYHLALNDFGEGPFWDVIGSWTIEPTEIKLDPVLEENRMLFVDRWLGENSFIGHDWSIANGPENLWTVTIPEQDTLHFFSGPLGLHAYDTAGSVVALDLQGLGESGADLEPGLYIQPRFGGTPVEVVAGMPPLSIEFSEELDRFVAGLPDRTVLFTRQGDLDLIIPRGGVARLTSGGGMILISSDGELAPPGAWVYTNQGALFQSLSEEPVRYAQWDPYSDGAFLLMEGTREVHYWPWLFNETYLVGQVDSPFFSGFTTVEK